MLFADIAWAAIVNLAIPSMTPPFSVAAELPIAIPDIPGLFGFQEGPIIPSSWGKKIESIPKLIFFDGHGIAHPRSLSIAAHLELWLDQPTIGIGKSCRFRVHDEPNPNRGYVTHLFDEIDPQKVIGDVFRTRFSPNYGELGSVR